MMRIVVKEAANSAQDVLEERSTDYTIEEVDYEVHEFKDWGWKLADLLKAAKAAAHQPALERNRAGGSGGAVYHEEGFGLLEEVKANLLTMSASRKRRATDPQPPAETTSVQPLPMSELPAAVPVRDNPGQASVLLTQDWLSNMLADLALMTRPQQGGGPRFCHRHGCVRLERQTT
jgi:hypothetical protein